MRIVLCAGLLAATIAGCGSAADPASVTTDAAITTRTAARETDRPAQARIQRSSSGVEDVPLPAGATRIEDGQWAVDDLSYDEAVGFYEQAMPEGEPWRGWAWCDTGGGRTIHAHIYARGSNRILNVSVVADEPPVIFIGTDRSGPC